MESNRGRHFVLEAGETYRFHVKDISARRQSKMGKVEGMYTSCQVAQLLEVLPIGGHEDGEVINRALAAACYCPIQCAVGNGGRQIYAIVHSGFDGCTLLVIVPGDKLES